MVILKNITVIIYNEVRMLTICSYPRFATVRAITFFAGSVRRPPRHSRSQLWLERRKVKIITRPATSRIQRTKRNKLLH